MIPSLLKETLITKVKVAVVAGVADITDADIIDLGSPTEGIFDSVLFVAVLGEVTTASELTLKAYCGDAATLSDGAYKTATAAVVASGNDTDNNLLVLDVIKPGKRYVRADLVIDTANAVVDSILAIRYNARTAPTTQTANVADSDLSVN
jgi:hypothetical protein